MTVTYNRTREQLARLILRKLEVLGSGGSDVSADMDIIYEAVDIELKRLHVDGIIWRKVTNVPVTFSLGASVATASAGAGDILFPLQITFTNGTDDDPVDIIGPVQWAQLPDKTRTGNPEMALWKGGSEFIFYPIPSANGTGKLIYEKIADDTSAGSAVDIDVAMLHDIRNIIAYQIGDDFSQPEGKMQRMRADAEVSRKNIRKLTALRVDNLPVAVDDFDSGNARSETDYGWVR